MHSKWSTQVQKFKTQSAETPELDREEFFSYTQSGEKVYSSEAFKCGNLALEVLKKY